MVKINLRKYYPFYEQDCYIDVADELAEMLAAFERAEEAYRRKLRRNHSYYSLDREDGIAQNIVFAAHSPEEIYERKITREELYAAIAALPDKQAKRIYAHYLLGMSKAEIAKAEDVCWSSVDRGIRQGLARIEKILKNR